MEKDFEKPILTVDVAYLSMAQDQLQILMIRRVEPPYQGSLALPGGYVHCDADQDLTDTAKRVIQDKIQLEPDYIEQVETIASKNRDPRGWTATVLHMALVNGAKRLDEEALPKECLWLPLEDVSLEELAFDHRLLIEKVRERLIAKSRYTSIPLYLLPQQFTLTEAQHIFEATTQATLEKKSFRRRLLDADIIEETGGFSETGKRKAALYQMKNRDGVHYFPRMIG